MSYEQFEIAFPALAAEINMLHEEAEKHANMAVIYAARCGAKLLEVKASLEHGQWLPWLNTNTTVSYDKSAKYMRIAKDMPELLVANFASTQNLPGITQALALIAADEDTKAIVQERLDAGESVTVREIEELKRQAAEKESEIAGLKARQQSLLAEKEGITQKLAKDLEKEKSKRKQAEAITKASDREKELARQKADAEARAERLASELASAKAQIDGGLGVVELLEPKVVTVEDTESKRELERVRQQLEEKTRLHELAVKHAGQFQEEMHKATSKAAYLENKLKEVEDTSVVLAVFARQVNDWNSQVGFVAAVLESTGQPLDSATIGTCHEIAARLKQLIELSNDQGSLKAA